MSSDTLLRTPSSFLSHLVVDTPSAGGRLTPGFFNSIFNDGMNPFDESFTLMMSNNAAALDLSFGGSSGGSSMAAKIKQSPLCNEKTAVMLPTIETGKTPDGDLLRRRPMSPLSPPISPAKPDTVVRSPNTRSPSPFTYPDPYLSTPSPSASPITSPDEPTPVIKQEQASPPLMPAAAKPRRRTISAGEKPKVTIPAEKPTAAPEKKSRSKSAHQIVVQQQLEAAPSAPPAKTAGKKRKLSAEPKLEEDDDDDMDMDMDNDDTGCGANKRARFLERNRVAASKCRKKKKLMNQRLEEKSRMLHQHNRYLNQLVSSLKSDVLRLKQCLLVHHDCEDQPIKRYLQAEAGKVFESVDRAVAPVLKSEPKVSPQLLDELEQDRINDLSEKWASRTRDLGAEFHSFQEVESAALSRLGKGSELSYDEELKLLFGDDMS